MPLQLTELHAINASYPAAGNNQQAKHETQRELFHRFKQ